MSSVITMPLKHLIKMNYVDFSAMHIRCETCHHKYGKHYIITKGRYLAKHRATAQCQSTFKYTTADILDWKRDDNQYKDIYRSLLKEHDKPVARVWDDWIVDGGHRLAACEDLGLKRVLVETAYESCASDSNAWYPGMPIDTLTQRND